MPRSPGSPWRRSVLIALLAAPCASAQTVRVRALEDSSRAPIGGALVRLLRGDSTLAQGLTSSVGRVTLLAPAPGRYLIRVSRIGYAVSAPMPIEVAAGETRGIDLALPAVRVNLPAIVVRGKEQCGGLPDERATAAVLWEQIRQGLTRTQLSERSLRLFTRDTAVRELTRGGVVREEHRSPEQRSSGKPFVTRPPAELASEGFVRSRGDSISFYAPDADLLLSDQFVATHCFTVSPPPDSLPGHIGLRFKPAAGRRVSDIRGVLWVERRTVELRLLEFQYTTSPLHGAGAVPGGRLAFGRLSSGEFYVRDWVIRMPKIGRSRSDILGLAGTERDSLLGYLEVSGRAAPAAEPRSIVTPAIVTGLVYDSLSVRGLAGVIVTVAGAPDRAVTDSLGTFALSVPVSGPRIVTLSHELLDLVPERTTRTVELVPGVPAHLITGTPGPAAVAQRMCRGETGAAGLVGRIARQPDRPLADISVEAAWFSVQGSAGLRRQTETTRSDERGVWAFCDLPGGVPVTVRQLDGEREVAAANETVDPLRFSWLVLSDTVAAAPAVSLPGLVVGATPNPASGEPTMEPNHARTNRTGAPPSAIITREEMQKTKSSRLMTVLMSHGIRIRVDPFGRNILLCPRNAGRPAIYIDGQMVDRGESFTHEMAPGPVLPPPSTENTSAVFDVEGYPLERIEAIEIYASPSQQPAGFNQSGALCTVLVWTRR